MKHRPQKQQLLLQPQPINLTYFEERFYAEGTEHIAGVDEAGRGCLAGPVVAASVILPKNLDINGLKDSKQLTSLQRDQFYDVIREKALAWSVGIVDSGEIDKINILRASLKAMVIAVDRLKIKPQFILVDGPQPIETKIPQKPIKKGDARSISIAAASVMAKVTRDRLMTELGKIYPSFSFSIHKGYGTQAHLRELIKHGPTPIHRMTFAPLKLREPQVIISCVLSKGNTMVTCMNDRGRMK